MAQSLFMTKWELYQGSIGRSGDVTSSCRCCVIYGWVWGQNIMIVCHWYVVQFIAFPRGLELLPCIIEFEDFIYSCKTWDLADWSRVVISFDRRVRPSSKHYTPASLWIVYFYAHRRLKFASRIEISTNIGLEPRSIRIPDPRVIPPPSTSRPEPQFWQRRSL